MALFDDVAVPYHETIDAHFDGDKNPINLLISKNIVKAIIGGLVFYLDDLEGVIHEQDLSLFAPTKKSADLTGKNLQVGDDTGKNVRVGDYIVNSFLPRSSESSSTVEQAVATNDVPQCYQHFYSLVTQVTNSMVTPYTVISNSSGTIGSHNI